MRIVRMIAMSATLAAIATLPAYAQVTRPTTGNTTPPRPTASPSANTANVVAVPDSKIAFVNTEAFNAEQGGIGRLVNALQTLQREFKPKEDELQVLQTKIRQIATDIENLNKSSVVSPTTIQTKQDDGARLQREFEYKQKDYEAVSQRRYREVVGPVSANIGRELDQFAKDRSITMILDVSKLLPAILAAKQEMDVTQAFIAYYNSRNPATIPAATPK